MAGDLLSVILSLSEFLSLLLSFFIVRRCLGPPPVVNSMGIPQLPCPSFCRRWPRGWPDATLPRLTCTRKLSDALNVVKITPDVSILKFKIRHTDELSILP